MIIFFEHNLTCYQIDRIIYSPEPSEDIEPSESRDKLKTK
jgi:hypothetical protein